MAPPHKGQELDALYKFGSLIQSSNLISGRPRVKFCDGFAILVSGKGMCT